MLASCENTLLNLYKCGYLSSITLMITRDAKYKQKVLTKVFLKFLSFRVNFSTHLVLILMCIIPAHVFIFLLCIKYIQKQFMAFSRF